MRILFTPTGWDELERHLIEWHDVDVEGLSADDARRLHADMHRGRIPDHQPKHDHA